MVRLCTRVNPTDRFFAYITQELYRTIVKEGLLFNRQGIATEDWKSAMIQLSRWYGLGHVAHDKFPSDLGIELYAGTGQFDYQMGIFFDWDDMPPLYFRSAHRIVQGLETLMIHSTWKVLAEGKSDFEMLQLNKTAFGVDRLCICLLYTSPSPRD